MTPPSLAVEPSVITETDQVTLRCQPPAFASGSVCYFFNLNGLDKSSATCHWSVRGSELLKENQSPPAEVEVQCYYRLYGKQSNSPYSDKQTVTIQSSRPEVIVEVITDQVVIICSLPEAAKSASTCYLYFGESPQPYFDKDVPKNLTIAKRQICTFLTSFDDLEQKFYTLKTKEISCDYSSVHGHKSARSDGYNMSAFIKNAPVTQPRVTQPRVTQPPVTTAVSEPVKTTNPSHVTGSETTASSSVGPVPNSTLKDSDLETIERPESGNLSYTKNLLLKLVVVLTVCGMSVGSVLLGFSVLCTKRAHGTSSNLNNSPDIDFDTANAELPTSSSMPLSSPMYSVVTSAPAIEGMSNSEVVSRNDLPSDDQYEGNTYHLYATIPDHPPPAPAHYSYLKI